MWVNNKWYFICALYSLAAVGTVLDVRDAAFVLNGRSSPAARRRSIFLTAIQYANRSWRIFHAAPLLLFFLIPHSLIFCNKNPKGFIRGSWGANSAFWADGVFAYFFIHVSHMVHMFLIFLQRCQPLHQPAHTSSLAYLTDQQCAGGGGINQPQRRRAGRMKRVICLVWEGADTPSC